MLSHHRVPNTLLAILLLIAVFCVCAQAQSQPASLSVSPGAIFKPLGTPHCYTVYVSNGAYMTLDVRYKFNNGPDEFIYGWPTLGDTGTAYVCTDSLTEVGLYTFTGVRNAATPSAPFTAVSSSVSVQAVPPQATGLSFTTGTQGYAGIDSYTLNAANTSMQLVVEYTINCTGSCPVHSTMIGLNPSGNYTHALVQNQVPGIYRYKQVRNYNRSDWVNVNGATYMVKPPKPTFLSINPTNVIAGHGSYVMTAGNSRNTFLDANYRFTPPGGSEGPEIPLAFPFWMNPTDPYSSNGQVAVFPEACNTPPGIYRYTWINNRDLALPPFNDTSGLPVSASVTVTPPEAPTFSYAYPPAGLRGQTNIDVTITGTNFCSASLSTSYSGLNVNAAPPVVLAPHTLVAKFSIAANAPVGNATVMITTPRGTASFSFTVAAPTPPSVTGITPASASAGSIVQVTITGSSLAGAVPSTSYAGLSIGSVSTTSTSISATFTLSTTAVPGNATIVVTTLSGTTTVAFGITPASGSTTGPASTREYVYLGGRLISVESFELSAQPPGPPQQLTAQALNQTTMQVHWSPAIPAPNKNITGYQIKRGGTVVATLAASQLSYLDTSAIQGTTYTFTAVAKDNTIPMPLTSANSNAATVTTPPETIPPTVPTNVTVGCEPYEWYYACEASWAPSSDTGGSGLRGYQVDLYGDYGVLHLDGPIAVTTVGFYTDSLHSLRVYALDYAGNISAPGIWQP